MRSASFFCSAWLLVASVSAAVPPQVDQLLDSYCFSCHDAETEKGDIRLDQLGEIPIDVRLELLNKVQEQVFFEEMPPAKKNIRKRI